MKWLFVLLAACGGKSEKKSDGFGGACDRREKEHLCVELWADHSVEEAVQKACEVAHGTASTEKCPRTGAIGMCVSGRGTPTEVHTMMYPPLTKQSVSGLCQGPGTKPELF